MLENVTLQYPTWFIFFCLLLGILYATFLYYKDQKFNESARWVKPAMAFFRFSTVSILSFLLLSPVVKNLKEEVKQPIIIIAQDKSQSIPSAVKKDDLAAYVENMKSLNAKLSEKFEVVNLNFGEDVVPATFDTFGYQTTNLSNAINYIYEGYVDQNIGAIILATDGIYNEGKNPLYENIKFRAPLYTVALGDTTLRKDLSISNVLHNKIAYLGDKSGIQVDISAKNAKGSNAKVSLYQSSRSSKKIIQEQSIKFDNENDYKTLDFLLETGTVGINKYTVSVSQISGETTYANNTRDFYIEVLDGKQKILVLADGPHPDIAALKNIITTNKNYEVTTAFAGQPGVNVGNFDLVIFHNLPSGNFDINESLDIINRKNTPRLFIVGAQTNQTKFNTIQNLVKISGNSNTNEDVQVDIQSSFNLFTISEALKRQLPKYPPLLSQFGEFKLQSVANSFLNQKIKKIATKYPLLTFLDQGGIKTAVLTGEGIWRWRLYDYQEFQNYDAVTELVNKTIQYLTVKEDKRKFRVNLAKNVYKETEDIIFDAQLYNNTYEMINDPDVMLSIRDENNKEYKYSFSKSNNYYTLNAGRLPEGNYRYQANVNNNGVTLDVKGKFTIQRVQLEQYNLTANHNILSSLSNKFNGKMYYPTQLSEMESEIMKNELIKPIVYISSSTQSLMNNKWIFGLLMLLLTLEWFMRRYFGSY